MPKIPGWSRDPFNLEGNTGDFGPRSKIVRSWGEDSGSGYIEITKSTRVKGGDISKGKKTVYNTSITDESNNVFSNRKYDTLSQAEKRAMDYMKQN